MARRLGSVAAGLLLGLVAWAAPAAAAFDEIEVSPRVRALAGSWVALSAEEYTPFHNPAALAWAGQVQGAASWLRPFGYDFHSQSVASVMAELPRGLGGVALGARRYGVEYQAEDLTRELTIAFSHGFKVVSDVQSELALGWTVDLYSLDYGLSVTGQDPGDAVAFGIHLGAQAVVRDRTRVGIFARNVNNPRIGSIEKEELGRGISAGVSYSPYPGVQTVLDVSNDLGEEAQFRGGAEFQFTDYVWLRAGLRTAPNVFSAGLGLRRARLQLDYGFSTGGGVLGETHHVGLGFALGGSSSP
jgi:hypothetical protein